MNGNAASPSANRRVPSRLHLLSEGYTDQGKEDPFTPQSAHLWRAVSGHWAGILASGVQVTSKSAASGDMCSSFTRHPIEAR